MAILRRSTIKGDTLKGREKGLKELSHPTGGILQNMNIKGLLLFLWFIPGGSSVYFASKISNVKWNHEKAMNICKHAGSEMPGLEAEFLNSLQMQTSERNRKRVWLRPTRRHFKTYKWLDGNELDKHTAQLGKKLGFSCVVIDLILGIYDFFPCETPELAFLCQFEGCKSCQNIGRTNQNCIEKENTCYVFNCGAESWYAAKLTCLKNDGSLAIWKDESSLNLLQAAGVTDSFNMCSNVWVGARLDDWIESDKSTSWFWAVREPQIGKDCLVLLLEDDQLFLESSECNARHHVMCRKDGILSSQVSRYEEDVATNRSPLEVPILLNFVPWLVCHLWLDIAAHM